MKQVKAPSEDLTRLWKELFYKDAGKFIGPTHIQIPDYHTEFVDKKGVSWKIWGSLEGKEMPCENLTTGEFFLWDRWQVSLLKHPEKHANSKRIVTVTYPEPEKKRKIKKVEDVQDSAPTPQLSLFEESEDTTT
jgi:hypothetical protein